LKIFLFPFSSSILINKFEFNCSLCKYLLEQFSQLHQSKSIDQAQGWSATLSFLLDSLENLQDAQVFTF